MHALSICWLFLRLGGIFLALAVYSLFSPETAYRYYNEIITAAGEPEADATADLS